MSISYTIDISENNIIQHNNNANSSIENKYSDEDFKIENENENEKYFISSNTNTNLNLNYNNPVSRLARGWMPPPSPINNHHKRIKNRINHNHKKETINKFYSDDETDFNYLGSGSVSDNYDFNDDCDFYINNINSNNDIMDVSYNVLSYSSVRRQINKDYEPNMPNRYSSALDILASYLKGQKIIYMESRNVTVKLLNWFMLPSIFLSAACSVLSQSLLNTDYGPHILAAFNVMVACLIAIINYLKLDAASEAHKISSHQYDKLQSSVEFTSGQVLLFSDPMLDRTLADGIWNEMKDWTEEDRHSYISGSNNKDNNITHERIHSYINQTTTMNRGYSQNTPDIINLISKHTVTSNVVFTKEWFGL
jgi:hypothetical protein